MRPRDLTFLVGPTGVGKTAIAIQLAAPLNAEILSIDSRAAYRRLELGTAKPSDAERAAATHHLLDLFEPHERASAGLFKLHFDRALADVRSRGRRALAVGGSGLYVDACLGRLDRLPPADPALRAAHERIAADDPAALHRKLQDVDPESAARLEPRDVQRVSRALEVYELTGTPLSRLQITGHGPLDLSAGPAMVILERKREDLYARIEQRAQAIIAAGLPDEVRRLLASGVPADAPGIEAIGYAEFARAVRGEISFAEATRLFILATRHYAKRQQTWFRNRYAGTLVIELESNETPEVASARILDRLAQHGFPRPGDA